MTEKLSRNLQDVSEEVVQTKSIMADLMRAGVLLVLIVGFAKVISYRQLHGHWFWQQQQQQQFHREAVDGDISPLWQSVKEAYLGAPVLKNVGTR